MKFRHAQTLMMGKVTTAFVLAFTVFSSAQHASAQTAPVPAVPENQIQLSVDVSSRAGEPVGGLTAANFTVLDDKTAQTLTMFKEVTPAPNTTNIVIVLDEVNNYADDFNDMVPKLAKYFRSTGTFSAPVMLVTLSNTGITASTAPTTNGEQLAASVVQNKMPPITDSTPRLILTGIQKAQLSLKTLGQLAAYERRVPGRKLIIWIGDGWPQLTDPKLNFDAELKADIFKNLVEYMTLLRISHVTLYNANPFGGLTNFTMLNAYKTQLGPVTQVYQAQQGSLLLQTLAVHSGGLVLDSGGNIEAQMRECLADASDYYLLTYTAKPSEKPNDFRRIEVKVDQSGVRVRHIFGYYAHPDPKAIH